MRFGEFTWGYGALWHNVAKLEGPPVRLPFLLFALIPAVAVSGQQPPAAGPGNAGATSPGAGSTGATNPGFGNTNPTNPGRSPFPGNDPTMDRNRFPEMQNRPIFISGKVMMEDGTPPPDSVTIERVCNGQVRPEGYTNSKGTFSIELGRNTNMLADASTSTGLDDGTFGRDPFGGAARRGMGGFGAPNSGLSERDLIGCEIRANLAGFRADSVNLAGRRFMDNPDIGTIVLRRIANVDGYTFSMTTALAPKEAKKSYEKALGLVKKNKTAEALVEIEKATAAYPKYAIAWYDQGRLYEEQKRPADAARAFQSAIAADSKYVKPYLNLAYLHAAGGQWEPAAEISAKGVKLNPFEYPQLHFINGLANLNLGKLDVAEKAAREAGKLDPKGRMPKVDQLLGVILAQKNDISGAKQSFANYLKKDPNAADAEQVRAQLAKLEEAPAAAAPVAAPAAAKASSAASAPSAPAEPAPVKSANVVSSRSAWPAWSGGISDLPPGTLSREMDAEVLAKETAGTVYSIVTAGDATQLPQTASEFQGAAVAVTEKLLVTHCDVMESQGTTGLYQHGKLVTTTVRLVKAKRAAGLCVLEAGGVKLRPVNGVRYAQDLTAGEKTYTVRNGALGEGTLQSAKLQGDVKLLVTNAPVSAASAGGGLFDNMGNLLGVTTLRSQSAVIAVEEYFQ